MTSNRVRSRLWAAALGLFIVLLVSAAGGSSAASGRAASKHPHAFAGCAREGNRNRPRWHPKPTTKPWQWQLQGRIDTGVHACVYDIDGFETPKRTVTLLHRRHVRVVCYLDVGSWESYRPDRAEFPRSVIGRRYQGFPDERWLDIAHFHRFERPLKQR
ncbi:MAG TPA: endo alpha-1,4 polygalactosaminidase, partial [Solirubrobacterales bacterium]